MSGPLPPPATVDTGSGPDAPGTSQRPSGRAGDGSGPHSGPAQPSSDARTGLQGPAGRPAASDALRRAGDPDDGPVEFELPAAPVVPAELAAAVARINRAATEARLQVQRSRLHREDLAAYRFGVVAETLDVAARLVPPPARPEPAVRPVEDADTGGLL